MFVFFVLIECRFSAYKARRDSFDHQRYSDFRLWVKDRMGGEGVKLSRNILDFDTVRGQINVVPIRSPKYKLSCITRMYGCPVSGCIHSVATVVTGAIIGANSSLYPCTVTWRPSSEIRKVFDPATQVSAWESNSHLESDALTEATR